MRSLLFPALFLAFTAPCYGQAAAADRLVEAPLLTTAAWVAPCSTVGATLDFNEPLLSGLEAARTVWWRWTAPSTGSVTITRTNPDDGVTLYSTTSYDTMQPLALALPLALQSGTPSRSAVANVVAGQTYAVQVETQVFSQRIPLQLCPGGYGQVSISYASGLPAPANDTFATRTLLTGSTADFTATTAGCGPAEASEPVPPVPGIDPAPTTAGPTAWYQWTAPAAGHYRLRILQETDALLAVYRGTSLGGLSRIGTATTYNGSDQTSVCFTAAAGESMQLQALGGGVGRFLIAAAVRPPNDDFANAAVVSGNRIPLIAWPEFSSREAGEPLHGGRERGSVWWKWVAPGAGILTISIGGVYAYSGTAVNALTRMVPAGSSVNAGDHPVTAGQVVWIAASATDRVEGNLTFRNAPANEAFANATLLSGNPVTAPFDASQSFQNTLWFTWTAPATGLFQVDTRGSNGFSRLELFTGSAANALTPLGGPGTTSTFVNYGSGGPNYGRFHLWTFNATAGVTYRIKLSEAGVVPGVLNISQPARPANDDWAAASTVTGPSWTVNASNVNATRESSEPTFYPESLWWKWTAPTSGQYRLTTTGSTVNSVLGLYTGSALASLTTVGIEGQNTMGDAGTLIFRASAGTVYSIQAAGEVAEQGTLRVAMEPWAAPPNDAFASAIGLLGSNVSVYGSLLGSTAESGETVPAGLGSNGGHSVWYSWMAPASGRLVVTASSADFDPGVAVYTGSAVNALSPNGSTGGSSTAGRTNTLVVQVVSGTTYRIAVDGTARRTADFRLSLTQAMAPANDAFANRTTLSGERISTVAEMQNASAQTGEPRHNPATPAARSAWWTWTAPRTAAYQIDTIGSSHRLIVAVYTGSVLTALTPVVWDSVVAPAETFSNVTLNATAGSVYQIALDIQSTSTGTDPAVLNINPLAEVRVPNDSFASARLITGDSVEDRFSLRGATAEPGEPAHGGVAAARSLWWKYIPRFNRRVQFWTHAETSPDAVRLNVYKGSALNALTAFTSRTDTPGYAITTVDLLGGETYYVAVDAASSLIFGSVRLGMTPPGGREGEEIALSLDGSSRQWIMTGAASRLGNSTYPPNDRYRYFYYIPEACQRLEWWASAPGANVTVSGRSVSGIGSTATGVGSAFIDVVPFETYVFSAMVQNDVPITVQLRTVAELSPLAGDPLAGPRPELTGAPLNFAVTYGHPFSNRQVASWIAPSDGIAEWRLTGNVLPTDSLYVFHEDDSFTGQRAVSRTNGGPPVVRLRVRGGQRVLVEVASPSGPLRTGQVTASLSAPSVPNDDQSAAQTLAADWSSVSGDLAAASRESMEPSHVDLSLTDPLRDVAASGRSLWYAWTPSQSGPVTLRLSGPGMTLAVYDTNVAGMGNPFATSPTQRSVTFSAGAGVRYLIAVAALGPEELAGPFTLSRTAAAANDTLANAVILSGATATSQVESDRASAEPGEPGTYTGNILTPATASLWWKWTAPANGLVYLDTLGSGFNTTLAVFATEVPDLSTRLAENDDINAAQGVLESAVALPAVAGRTYLIRIDRAPGAADRGAAQLNLTTAAPPTPYQCWLTTYPALTGPAAAINADPDGDGRSNLMELAFGTNPIQSDAPDLLRASPTFNGWQTEVWLDTAALVGCGTGRPIEVHWEASTNLHLWTRRPDAPFIRREGDLSLFRLTQPLGDARFLRLRVVQP